MITRSFAAALLCAAAMPAFADNRVPEPKGTIVPAADVQNAQGAEPDEIIVTGEKSKRTLQDTPASVAVTTKETITQQNILSVYDVLDRTPNLAVNADRSSFSIRGIDAFSVVGGGDGALASVYIDGAVLPQQALSIGPLDLYDIAQVEVFRGPQSTVQGRNALAGAVIVRTTDPTFDWSGTFRLQMSDADGGRRAGAAIGGPILADQLAFRIAGEVARADGFNRDVTLNTRSDERASETIRGKLLFTPTALPDLRIVGTYLHDRHQRGEQNIEFQAPYTPNARVSTSDVPTTNTVTSDITTLEIGYQLAHGLSLNSVTNYSRIRSFNVYDNDRNATPGQVGSIRDPEKTFQQELRLNIDRGWVQGLIGGYYLRDDNRDYFFAATQDLQLRRLGVDRQLLALGLNQPTVDAVLNLYGGNGAIAIRNSLSQPRLTTNYAGFADLTFPIIGGLKLRTGLRYDHERQLRGATQMVVITQPLPNPAAVGALGPIVTQLNALLEATATGANSVDPLRTVTYKAWLPKIGLTYAFDPDLSLSATAQRGYRAGGAGLNQQRALAFEYNPEYTWNYELALRSQWFDRQLTVNANAYYIDWRDQQVSVQLTPGSVFDTQVVNAGRSRLYGFELELSGRPTRTLNLYAGLGYSNSKFLDFSVPAGSSLNQGAEGNSFAVAPNWTASGGATWQHPSGMFANLNANFRDAYYQSTTDQTVKDIAGRTQVNAKIGWQGRHFGAFLTASNIFNDVKPTAFFTDSDGRVRGVLAAPRVLGLSFEGRF